MPELLNATQLLGEARQPVAVVSALQHLKQDGHPNRSSLQSAPEIRLGASGVAQPVFEKALQIIELCICEAGHRYQRFRGNH